MVWREKAAIFMKLIYKPGLCRSHLLRNLDRPGKIKAEKINWFDSQFMLPFTSHMLRLLATCTNSA